ncbi:outer membrane beta-barrel family protein [uncultured Croceitalea sp.]|uniref:outer membrane beta-barrel family protein n=1 Tax=uncultured Croceitalea sp. TaxID=1798908 RepID=UPI0033058940
MKQIAFLSFFVISRILFGQESTAVSGTVTTVDGRAIPIADVLLYDVSKESIVQYCTIIDGVFQMTDIIPDTYYLSISAIGYETYTKKIGVSKNLSLEIVLKESVMVLSEVEVVAAKSPISNQNGNLKVNMQHPVFSSIADPIEVLMKLPNVQVAPDRESISVINKGNPLIYLGNQRIGFEEFLGLAVEAIESIELINNPSVKYEAEGRAVLLVRLKKTVKRTSELSISQTASFKRNYNNYILSNGSFSNGKWNIRGNLGFNDLGFWESNTFEFTIPSAGIFSDYFVLIPRNNRKQLNAGLGFYHPLKNDDYFSFNTTIRLQSDDAPIETDTFLRNGTIEDNIITDTSNDGGKDYWSANFNYNKELGKSISVYTGLQYTKFMQDQNAEISNSFNGERFLLDQIRLQDYKIGSLAFRVDFTYKISKTMTWEFGANLTEARADSFTRIQNLDQNQETIFDFDYEEQLYSGYSNFSGSMAKKVDFNLGFRTEYNKVLGELKNEEEALLKRANTWFFPKAAITTKLDSVKTISMNYARTISRPNYSRTSTITTFINPFLEGANNVNLLPALTDELSANLQWKNKSLTLGLYKTDNPRYFTIDYELGAEFAELSLVNLEEELGYYVTATLPFSYKKWTSTNTVSLTYNKMRDSNARLGSTRPYLYVYSSQQFKIGESTTLAFGGWALTKRREGIFKRNGLLVLEASINTKLFKKLDASLRLNDITRAMNFRDQYAINGVEADGTFFADAREIAISLKYKFGRNASNTFKNKNVDENLNRIR